MKKMMMAVAGLAMAVVLTGCGGSPKSVAEDFATAIVQKEPGKAFEFYDTVQARGTKFSLRTKDDVDALKKALEELGKKINDDKYECKAILEQYTVPPEDSIGYVVVNGSKKYVMETATVTVQYVKGKDKKPDGLVVNLMKVDGSWKVTGYNEKSNLDTSDAK